MAATSYMGQLLFRSRHLDARRGAADTSVQRMGMHEGVVRHAVGAEVEADFRLAVG